MLIIIIFNNKDVINQFHTKSNTEFKKVGQYQPIRTDYVAGVFQYEDIAPFSVAELGFELKDAPNGMKIGRFGRLSWIPYKSSEGKSYNVTLKVKDRDRIEQSNFLVKVATTRPMRKKIYSSSVVIDDKDCKLSSLNDESFTLAFHDFDKNINYEVLEKVKIEMITSKVNYYIPPNLKQYSCFFKIGEIEHSGYSYEIGKYNFSVKLIASHRKALLNRSSGKLKLYKFTDMSNIDIDTVDGQEVKSVISPIWTTSDYLTINGLFFIGVDDSKNKM